MTDEIMIPIETFCLHHHIDQSLIWSFREYGLVETTTIKETIYVQQSQLPHLEKLIHLYEMDINLEGIQAITHLLDQVNDLNQEVVRLSNRLSNYE